MNLMAAVALRLIKLYGQVVNIIAILRPKDGATEMEACARENELTTIEARNRRRQSRVRTNWLGGPWSRRSQTGLRQPHWGLWIAGGTTIFPSVGFPDFPM